MTQQRGRYNLGMHRAWVGVSVPPLHAFYPKKKYICPILQMGGLRYKEVNDLPKANIADRR